MMAQAYHVRPSALLGLEPADPRAFALDRAVMHFGSSIEQDQEAAEKALPKKASETMRAHVRQRVLDTYLGVDPANTPGRFRDPVVRKG